MTALTRELSFLLYECLDVQSLPQRERYREHGREAFDAMLLAAQRMAAELFAPHYAKADAHEPRFVDGDARVLPDIAQAWQAFADSGFLSAHWDAQEGGIQLPEPVFRAAMAHFFAANVSTAGYGFLTIGAANLLRTFGSEALKQRYLPAMGDGRSAGTMALTEPGQGSALGDIQTLAIAQADGSYRIVGQKMFISGGAQDFTGNIVHMVLARIQGATAGAKGISLFLVPKFLAGPDGAPGERNDVALAGLLHKMGWRGLSSTVLSFGENGGATGWLVGEANRGLAHMFQLMNEARIGVGLIAACLAYRGLSESLAYARERPQGRLPSSRDPSSPQVLLVQHADVRRMLLAQKACAEGALALCLHASAWFEDQHTHPDAERRREATALLDLMTPVVKSWPARHGCRANDLAIQVLGGAGYTREYPLEQLYRDQRLNPIHEGTEGIHGLDLLGRKAGQDGGAGLRLFLAEARGEAERAPQDLRGRAGQLLAALQRLDAVSTQLQTLLQEDPDLALANAVEYLDAFGTVTVAWLWLKQATVAVQALADGAQETAFYCGKLQTAHYFFDWELPRTQAQFERLESVNRIPFDTQVEWL